MARHDTPYPTYRRAGLCFEQESKPYEVTQSQLEILQNDPWIVTHEIVGPKKTTPLPGCGAVSPVSGC